MDREQQKEKARERRNHKFRIRRRAREYAKHVYGHNERELYSYPRVYVPKNEPFPSREKYIQDLLDRCEQMAETRPRCSCSMCGNPRRHFKVRTRQELKGTLDTEAQLEEMGIPRDRAKSVYQRILRRRTNW